MIRHDDEGAEAAMRDGIRDPIPEPALDQAVGVQGHRCIDELAYPDMPITNALGVNRLVVACHRHAEARHGTAMPWGIDPSLRRPDLWEFQTC